MAKTEVLNNNNAGALQQGSRSTFPARLFLNVPPEMYSRLLTTEEASMATGVSQYELRKGGAEGRYPVILLGSPSNKFRKMRWRLDALEEAILKNSTAEVR